MLKRTHRTSIGFYNRRQHLTALNHKKEEIPGLKKWLVFRNPCCSNRWVSSVVIEVSNGPARSAGLVYGDANALSGLPIMACRVETSATTSRDRFYYPRHAVRRQWVFCSSLRTLLPHTIIGQRRDAADRRQPPKARIRGRLPRK